MARVEPESECRFFSCLVLHKMNIQTSWLLEDDPTIQLKTITNSPSGCSRENQPKGSSSYFSWKTSKLDQSVCYYLSLLHYTLIAPPNYQWGKVASELQDPYEGPHIDQFSYACAIILDNLTNQPSCAFWWQGDGFSQMLVRFAFVSS
jgi:hypothetical protein